MATVQTPNEAQHDQDAASQRKRKFWLGGLALLVILVGLGIWGWHEMYGRWSESTDDAYVNGNVVEITPLVTGTVVSIGADDGDLVHEGQVLLNFDPSDSGRLRATSYENSRPFLRAAGLRDHATARHTA